MLAARCGCVLQGGDQTSAQNEASRIRFEIGESYEVGYDAGLENGVMHCITGTFEQRVRFQGDMWMVFGVSLGKFLIREEDVRQVYHVRRKRGWEL